MGKIFSTIILLLFLYVGFCGVKINDDIKIPPFIANFMKSDEGAELGKKAIDMGNETLDSMKESVKEFADNVSEEQKKKNNIAE